MQRHRNNPSNGFRSNPVPVYRNYNRGGGGGGGYGRAHHQQPRRIDVFYEAGKLAADYLLAKGLLNPNNNSNSNKWQNSNVSDSVSVLGSRRRSLDDPRGDSSVRGAIEVKSPVVELNRDVRSEEKVDESVSVKDEELKTVLEDLESKNVEPMIVDERKEVTEEKVVVKNDVLDADECEVESEVKNVDTEMDVVTDDVNVTKDEVKEEAEDETSVKDEVTDENENKNKNDDANDGGSDLLTFKVPTKTRSSVTLKGSKSDSMLICRDENKVKNESSEEVEVKSEEVVNNEVKKMKPVDSDEDDMYKFGLGLHMRSQSFPQRSMSELEINDGIHGYSRCSSEVLGRGEKRPMEINNSVEITKKQKNWVSANPQLNNYFNLSGSRGVQSPSQEKQLFPNSFKICDLNLMGVSEANENHDTNSVIGFSSIAQAKQEPVSVGFDLTMNNSCGIGDRHIRHGTDVKGVEVIDLDCDVQDDNNNSDRRDEAIFTDLESFPDSMQRVNNMPEDGYGLMISELLDTDIPNSSVSTGVNSMHNDMSSQNEEEILGDDESIYMSLGEIPISFVPVWDQQPSQGYDKRY